MRISIFGMGYVGVVTGACFVKEGHTVLGVDVSQHKVDLLRRGESPVVEEGIRELVSEGVAEGRLLATTDAREAVLESDISLISVGTPSRPNGALDLRAIETVSEQIGDALAEKRGPHTVILRSTLLPGTTRRVILPRLEERSKKRCGAEIHVCYNPEFLREGSSIKDFYSAPFTILGISDEEAGDLCAALYSCVKAPVHRCTLEEAEAVKYVSNTYHALKVAYANELGVVFRALGVDSHAVTDLAWQDQKLNISKAYLRPGYAFGGSCLPKDVRALVYAGKERDLELPLLSNLMASNRTHVERAVRMVLDSGSRDVALLGLSFKAGTDDLRESPLVSLAEQLIGKGCRLRVFDPDVVLARLTGANRLFIEKEIPHIGELLTDDFGAALDGAEVAVIGNARICDFAALASWAKNATVIDLARLPREVAEAAKVYHGICW